MPISAVSAGFCALNSPLVSDRETLLPREIQSDSEIKEAPHADYSVEEPNRFLSIRLPPNLSRYHNHAFTVSANM
jgi:hypothetical protein